MRPIRLPVSLPLLHRRENELACGYMVNVQIWRTLGITGRRREQLQRHKERREGRELEEERLWVRQRDNTTPRRHFNEAHRDTVCPRKVPTISRPCGSSAIFALISLETVILRVLLAMPVEERRDRRGFEAIVNFLLAWPGEGCKAGEPRAEANSGGRS